MARARGLTLLLAVLAIALFLPRSWVDGTPLCMFRLVTGWECPGCGLTRAFIAMVHGQWREMVLRNALAPVVLLYLTIYAADGLYTGCKGLRPNWYSQDGKKWITVWFGVLIFGQWAYKSGLHLINLYFN